jgi:hypothetical protein
LGGEEARSSSCSSRGGRHHHRHRNPPPSFEALTLTLSLFCLSFPSSFTYFFSKSADVFVSVRSEKREKRRKRRKINQKSEENLFSHQRKSAKHHRRPHNSTQK